MNKLTEEDLSLLSEEELEKLFEACQYMTEDAKRNPFFHFKPLKTQQKFLDSKAPIKSLFGGNQGGKGLWEEEFVFTDVGYKPIKTLKIGDTLFDRNGQPTKVKEIFVRGNQDCFRFVFSDNKSLIVDRDHLWCVYSYVGHLKNDRVLSTEQLLTTHRHWWDTTPSKAGHKRPHCSIPSIAPINLQSKDLPLDPYLVGLLLGDGGLSQRAVNFTSKDESIVDQVKTIISRYNCSLKHRINYDYAIIGNDHGFNRVLEILRQLGLMGHLSYTKFVPEIYKMGSINQRLEVLQGLMDTDGWCDKNSTVFYTVSKTLADDVIWLTESLGGQAWYRTQIRTYEKHGVKVPGALCYEVRLNLKTFCPFKLPRKVASWNKGIKTTNKSLLRIEPVGKLPTICIKVDSPTETFLAKDQIVTHNTTTGAFAVIKDCIENPGHHWWCGSETQDISIKVQQFKVNQMLPKDEIEPSVIYSSTRGFRNGVVTFKNGSTIGFKTFAQERERWQGGTLHGIWLDEEPPWDIYQECLPRLVAHNGQLIFTMTSLCGFTKVVEMLIHGDKNKGIETFFISTWENSTQFGGALDPKAIEQLESQYDDPDERKARIHGIPSPKSGIVFKNFQDAFPTVIPLEKCNECNQAWPTIVSIDPHGQTPHCVLWVQVAPSGHLYVMKERGWLQSEAKLDRVPWITLDELARQIQWENYALNIEDVIIDKFGSGAQNAITGTSIVDELFRKGLVCQPAGGDVVNKILITQRYFREKRIHIQASCWNLLWEIRRYVWQEHVSSKTAERREEHQKPRKKDDHLVDCLMNAVAYINSKNIVQQVANKTDSVRRNPNELESINSEDLYRRQNEEYHPDLLSIYE